LNGSSERRFSIRTSHVLGIFLPGASMPQESENPAFVPEDEFLESRH
jgi:hypothetical protein